MSKDVAQRALSIIENCEIYLSSPSLFNDVFDCRPVIRCNLTDPELIQRFIETGKRSRPDISVDEMERQVQMLIEDKKRDPREEQVAILAQKEFFEDILKPAGVYSVSTLGNDPLMWSHYADNHRGICLEFNGDSGVMREAQEVIYSVIRPVIYMFDNTTSRQKNMETALLTKSCHWRYEQEWRIARMNGIGPAPFDPDDLTGVIFGAEVSSTVKESVIAAVKRSRSRVTLYQAVPNHTTFEIDIEPYLSDRE